MTAHKNVSILFAKIVRWAVEQGADNIQNLPGVWSGETDKWAVKINGHDHEIDDVPQFSILLEHKTAFMTMAIVSVNGGHVIGATEDDLTAHFDALLQGVN